MATQMELQQWTWERTSFNDQLGQTSTLSILFMMRVAIRMALAISDSVRGELAGDARTRIRRFVRPD